MQAVYVLFRDDNDMKLPYFIALAGLACGVFAICIPHLSALRIWLAFSTFFSLVYIVIGFSLALKDGACLLPFFCFLFFACYISIRKMKMHIISLSQVLILFKHI